MITITQHAADRYRERVRPCSEAQARQALDSPAAHTAAEFGAPFVRLPTGHRIVLKDHTVVTVLPEWTRPGTMGRE